MSAEPRFFVPEDEQNIFPIVFPKGDTYDKLDRCAGIFWSLGFVPMIKRNQAGDWVLVLLGYQI